MRVVCALVQSAAGDGRANWADFSRSLGRGTRHVHVLLSSAGAAGSAASAGEDAFLTFLRNNQLTEYADALIDRGFNTIRRLRELTEEDLDAIHVSHDVAIWIVSLLRWARAHVNWRHCAIDVMMSSDEDRPPAGSADPVTVQGSRC